jgi:biopolymer transport protein ExbB
MIWFYEAAAAIREFMELGGNVLWAIMLTLFLMWTLILERVWYLYKVHPARQQATLDAWEAREDTTSWYARRIREGLISEVALEPKHNVGMIKALIAVCPLLGLLGTSRHGHGIRRDDHSERAGHGRRRVDGTCRPWPAWSPR